MPLDAIEAAAVRAVREDPWRSWEFIQFGPTPLPSTTVRQKRALNPRRGPLDSAEAESIMKVAYTTASWRACKPERVKNDGRVLPAERPSVFETEEEAHATLDRYHRLGTRVGVPLSGHLSYGVVCPLSEWEATAGQPTADRETQQLQAEAEMERIKVAKRSLQEQYDDLMAKVRAPHLWAAPGSVDTG
jgi:hypothetical protein